MLDIVVFPAAGSLDWINQAMSALAERHLEDGTIHYFTSKDFEISCEPPLNCHIDGELIGTTPVRYAVKPGALRIRF
jgi:diacylglycerol kinase family enzyme